MPKENQADLFEADGVTPKAAEKPVITPELLDAEKRAAAAEGKADGLKEALKAIPKVEKPKASEPAKEYTRAELRAQVNDGKITEDQMDDILERQLEAKLSKKVAETVETRVSASQTADIVGGKIAAYVEVYPAINETNSALRAKIETEFQDLVKNGADPDKLSTELAAIKIVCGPLKTGAGRKPGPESHQDIGGVGEGDGKPETDGPFKGISARHKAHYEKMIARGVYSGPKDKMLVKELSRLRGAH